MKYISLEISYDEEDIKAYELAEAIHKINGVADVNIIPDEEGGQEAPDAP